MFDTTSTQVSLESGSCALNFSCVTDLNQFPIAYTRLCATSVTSPSTANLCSFITGLTVAGDFSTQTITAGIKKTL